MTDSVLPAAGFASEQFLIEQLERIAGGMVATLGESLCEVVIHDFRQPEHSIVWIQGQVTRRITGGTMSQIGLEMLKQGQDAQDRINYITRTRDGKILKSSTITLRDAAGKIFGALCINIDVTQLFALEQTLHNFLSADQVPVVNNVQYGGSLSDVAQVMLKEVVERIGAVGSLDLERRLELVRALDRRGFFSIRYSIPMLADFLDVSRATIYNYLKDVLSDNAVASNSVQSNLNGNHQA